MKTRIIVVRHGETAWNADGRLQGHRPVDLNARGARQARAVADRLAAERFDALYSSDLARAMQTAQTIADATGHTIRPDARLREWNLGVLEGLTPRQARVEYPDAYRTYSRLDPDPVIPGGESIRQRYERSTRAVAELAGRHAGESVVVVSHGGVLDDLYRRATGLLLEAPRTFKLYNASLNILEIADGAWTLIRWADIDHLRHIGSMGEW